MNQITHWKLQDFIAETTFPIYGRINGYVIALEERDGSHLLKSINIHPGNDKLSDCLKDCAAEVTDSARIFKSE